MHLKRLCFLVLLIGVFPSFNQASAKETPATKNATLCFIENKGQITDQYGSHRQDIDFRLSTNGLSMFVTSSGIHYQWSAKAPGAALGLGSEFSMYRMDVELIGANRNARPVKEQMQPYTEVYYTGASIGSAARSFQRIRYLDVYPGIDWVLYVKDNVVEHDFVVHPGASVADIRIAYKGASSLFVNPDGSLTAITPMGRVSEKAPFSFQDDGKVVASGFVLSGNVLSFATGSYEGTLTIDPTLSWASYFGDAGYEECNGITTDAAGNAYVTGVTFSTANIATTGSFQTTYGGSNLTAQAGDAYLAKYNCSGTIDWITYFGGTAGEKGWNVVTDRFGSVYLSGFVNSNGNQPATSIATPGSHQPTFGGGDADLFLAKFNSSGQRIWSTYYGGSGNEGIAGPYLPSGLTCDTAGNVLLSGTTNSPNSIATPTSFQPALAGGFDAFIVKFDSSGQRIWASYFGGSSDEKGNAVVADIAGNIYLAGTTNSSGGINNLGFQSAYGGGTADGFVAKFDNNGLQQWSSYYGGSNTDEGHSLACDSSGNVFFAGRTKSTGGIATVGAFQEQFAGGLWDAFLVKFNSAGQRQFGTYYGGLHQGSVIGFSALSIDVAGNVYLGGMARELDTLSTPGSYQATNGGLDDGLLAKFDNSGQRLWSTYYGGAALDMINSVACDQFGNIYAAGRTASTSAIASANGYQPSFGGGNSDGFVIKFNEASTTPQADTILGPVSVCQGVTNTYRVTPVPGASSYVWSLPAGWLGSSTVDTIDVVAAGTSDTIKVTPVFSCGSGAMQFLLVDVIPPASITAQGPLVFCAGDSVQLKANTEQVTGWQWMNNGTVIPNAIDSVLTVLQSGAYSVITTSALCTDTSALDTVVVHALPQPLITRSGSDLTTGSFVSYQWNHNNAPITGATAQSYTMILFSGTYSVTVTDSNGCTNTSASYHPLSITNIAAADQVSVYPNPAKDHLTVKAPFPVVIKLINVVGKTVVERATPGTIDISSYASGLYLLNVFDEYGKLIRSETIVKE